MVNKKILQNFSIFVSCALFSLASLCQAAEGKNVPIPIAKMPNNFTWVAKEAIPSVVSIRVQMQSNSSDEDFSSSFGPFNDDLWRRFFDLPNAPNQSQRPLVTGQGSGFLVSADGYILTNNHVVKDATNITVILNDGKEYSAKVIGGDPNTDVAVVKINAQNLPFLKLGNSEELEVGQPVAAIGNPFGLQATLTSGVVSAKGRSNLDITPYEDYIQTDAAINRGNSGGPLLDLNGNVVGITTAIASNTGGYMGIGFAIPSNIIKKIMDQLISTGSVTRGYLGIVLQRIDKDLAQAFNLDSTKGALIAEVAKNSPADKAKLKQGDIILKYDTQTVENIGSFRNTIALIKPGTPITLTVKRQKEMLEIPLTVEAYPKKDSPTGGESSDLLGLSVQNLTPELAQNLGYQDEQGVIVTKVEPNSISSVAGIKKGSLIIGVNHQKVSTTEEFHDALAKNEQGKPVLLLIKQGQVIRFVSLKAE